MRYHGQTPYYMDLQTIADALGISKQRVLSIEQSALKKLARSPILRQLAEDLGIVTEDDACRTKGRSPN